LTAPVQQCQPDNPDLRRAWDHLMVLAVTHPAEWLSKAEIHQAIQWMRVVPPPPSNDYERTEFNFAWALNEVLCEIIESGETESRRIAAKVTANPKIQEWLRLTSMVPLEDRK
jgi:hypothetical protein